MTDARTVLGFTGMPQRLKEVPRKALQVLAELHYGRHNAGQTGGWPETGLFVIRTEYGELLLDIERVSVQKAGWFGKSGTFQGQISDALRGGWTWTDATGTFDTWKMTGSVSFPGDVKIL